MCIVYTTSKAKDVLKTVAHSLKESDTFTEQDALGSLLELCQFSKRRDEDLVDEVAARGFADLFMIIWRKLNEVNINDQVIPVKPPFLFNYT